MKVFVSWFVFLTNEETGSGSDLATESTEQESENLQLAPSDSSVTLSHLLCRWPHLWMCRQFSKNEGPHPVMLNFLPLRSLAQIPQSSATGGGERQGLKSRKKVAFYA